MSVELKELKVSVPKEVDDVMILVRDLVSTIKQKGDFTKLMGDFVAAVQGIDQVDDAAIQYPFKVSACVLNRANEIAEALLSKPASDGGGDPV